MSKLAVPVRAVIRFDGDSATVNYIGEAAFGSPTSSAVWRIKRLTLTGDSFVLDWAEGNDNFDNIWDNRASLTYL